MGRDGKGVVPRPKKTGSGIHPVQSKRTDPSILRTVCVDDVELLALHQIRHRTQVAKKTGGAKPATQFKIVKGLEAALDGAFAKNTILGSGDPDFMTERGEMHAFGQHAVRLTAPAVMHVGVKNLQDIIQLVSFRPKPEEGV
jgi:hypothetical protein